MAWLIDTFGYDLTSDSGLHKWINKVEFGDLLQGICAEAFRMITLGQLEPTPKGVPIFIARLGKKKVSIFFQDWSKFKKLHKSRSAVISGIEKFSQRSAFLLYVIVFEDIPKSGDVSVVSMSCGDS